MSNIYYSPEDFKLKTVDVIDFGESYEFDMIVVWRTVEGPVKFYWAQDSGCSCPTPFENHYSVETLEVLNKKTWDDFEKAVMGAYRGSTAEKQEFIRRVEKEFRKK
jgi:hypothetical protein